MPGAGPQVPPLRAWVPAPHLAPSPALAPRLGRGPAPGGFPRVAVPGRSPSLDGWSSCLTWDPPSQCACLGFPDPGRRVPELALLPGGSPCSPGVTPAPLQARPLLALRTEAAASGASFHPGFGLHPFPRGVGSPRARGTRGSCCALQRWVLGSFGALSVNGPKQAN